MTKGKINLVSSYPKSGATWFRFLLFSCTKGYLNSSGEIGPFYPEIHQRQDLIKKKLINTKKTFFVKSHFPYSENIPFIDKINFCIYLVRHPLDVLVSKLNHYVFEGNQNVLTKKGQRRFFLGEMANHNAKAFERSKNDPSGGWNHHVNSWLDNNKNITVYTLKYENILENTFLEISHLNKALNLGLESENIKRGCELSSFGNMQKLEEYELINEIPGMFYTSKRRESFLQKKVRFVNKATPRIYKQVMDDDIIKKGIETYGENMLRLGYI